MSGQSEINRLRNVLRPFANLPFTTAWPNPSDDDTAFLPNKAILKVRHFKEARAALEETQ